MDDTTIVKQTAAFNVTAELEYRDLGGDLAVYRLTVQHTAAGTPAGLLRHCVAQRISEGFASLDALVRHSKGLRKFPPPSEGIRLMPPGFLEAIERYGFSDGWDRAFKENPQYSHDKPFTALVDEGARCDQVLRVDNASHMVFDRRGRVLPTAIFHDYIAAGMHNARYDLQRALEILKNNKRVHFVDRHQRGTSEGKILPIEYYNAEAGRDQYLCFWFQPTQEEQEALWAKQQSYGTKYPSTDIHRAIFDLDTLGLRAGGAAYYQDFYKSRDYADKHE